MAKAADLNLSGFNGLCSGALPLFAERIGAGQSERRGGESYQQAVACRWQRSRRMFTGMTRREETSALFRRRQRKW